MFVQEPPGALPLQQTDVGWVLALSITVQPGGAQQASPSQTLGVLGQQFEPVRRKSF